MKCIVEITLKIFFLENYPLYGIQLCNVYCTAAIIIGVLLGVVPDLVAIVFTQTLPLISLPGGGLMMQGYRYPSPSGQEWERNSRVLPFTVLDHCG